MSYLIEPGKNGPLGAIHDGNGTNFALFSANAEAVELCIFDASGMEELQRLKLPTFMDNVFCGYVPNLDCGTLYGYRCHGQYIPEKGLRFNPHKLLIDPYARNLSSKLVHHNLHYDYELGKEIGQFVMDTRDSAPVTPKCIVSNKLSELPRFQSPYGKHETIIYEMHVKGYSKTNAKISSDIRGTYRAIASDESIAHLKDLGVTAIELLPIHASTAEPFLRDKDMDNYWGYNQYHYFAFNLAYAKEDALEELRYVTRRLHEANIQVIIDVVYNHTAEGNEYGPTYSFKGIDNLSYYALDPRNKSVYWNHSGCGNSLDLNHPRVLQLVMDSLRYLVQQVGVDGFRFDLASSLGRDSQTKFSNWHQFFSCLKQDPLLSEMLFIAEPWDIGKEGYQLGNYPHDWFEWNDQFRDDVRRFWLGGKGTAAEFAKRMHGSSDIFTGRGRSPYVSLNFLTAHDGFTLRDLVSYNMRHNDDNEEGNRDGHSANYSYNHGVEGFTKDSAIKALRLQQRKNLLASLLLAQGTPMLLAGDEVGNSQQGNNNAYCQDNVISWINWENDDSNELFAFIKMLIKLRRNHPLINHPSVPHGLTVSDKTGLTDISWLRPDGQLMTAENWTNHKMDCFAMMLAATHDINQFDEKICSLDDAIILIFNRTKEQQEFSLPKTTGYWKMEFDTSVSGQEEKEKGKVKDKDKLHCHDLQLAPHSFVMCSYVH